MKPTVKSPLSFALATLALCAETPSLAFNHRAASAPGSTGPTDSIRTCRVQDRARFTGDGGATAAASF